MPNDKYDEGYTDGRREADYQKSHSAVDFTIRNIGHDPQKSDNPAYKGGFNEGVKDGGGWAHSSNSGK